MKAKINEAKIFLINHKASSVYGLSMYLGIEKIDTLNIIKKLLDKNFIKKVPLYEDGTIMFLPDTYTIQIKKPSNKNGHKMKSLINQSLF